MVSCASCRLRIISLFNKLIKLVGRYSASYPESYADRLFAKLRICLTPYHFGSKHHLCNTVSLLCGEQAECVTEHNGYAAISIVLISIRRSESPVGNNKCHKTKISLSLTAAGRKVKQVDNLTVFMFRINNSREIHQNKGNLERTPSKIVVRILRINEILEIALCSGSVLLCIAFDTVLQEDYTVHKAECFKRDIVIFNNADTFTYTLQSILATVNDLVTNFILEIRIAHPCISKKRRIYPLLVGLCQGIEFADGFCLLRFY